MLLRNGKFASLSNQQSCILPDSKLRSGKEYRKEFKQLKWINMVKLYDDFILSSSISNNFDEKLIPSDVKKQLYYFQTKINNVVDNILKDKYEDTMDSQMIDIYMGLRFLRENINLFFCPSLTCNKECLDDIKMFVEWFQEILDWLNNTPTFLQFFTYKHLIDLSEEFEPIYNIWTKLEVYTLEDLKWHA